MVSTMENGGGLIEAPDYPAEQEAIDMERYYESKYESCPFKSPTECRSCPLVDCRQRIESEGLPC